MCGVVRMDDIVSSEIGGDPEWTLDWGDPEWTLAPGRLGAGRGLGPRRANRALIVCLVCRFGFAQLLMCV